VLVASNNDGVVLRGVIGEIIDNIMELIDETKNAKFIFGYYHTVVILIKFYLYKLENLKIYLFSRAFRDR
jgi:hypothetical protein